MCVLAKPQKVCYALARHLSTQQRGLQPIINFTQLFYDNGEMVI